MQDPALNFYSDLRRHAAGAASPCRLANPQASLTLDNPLCGDRVTLDVTIIDERVAEFGYAVRGCLVCQAATAMLADVAIGLTVGEAGSLYSRLACWLENAETSPPVPAHFTFFRPVTVTRQRWACLLLPLSVLAEMVRD